MDELVMAVQAETMEHEKDCRCGLCTALEAVEGACRHFLVVTK